MKNVLVAFNEPKLIKAITKNVRKSGAEDIVFTIKPTKAAFLDEIASGNYSCAILMESVGRDPWTIAEMVEVADSYNTTLIPIISETYKGGKEIVLLSSVGITSAVFVRKGGVYRADEVLRMIEHPRTLREARMYYGIETYADHKAGDLSMATENKISEAKGLLSANRENEGLGQTLLQILVEYRFDMAQAAQLLEHLDKDMTMRLQKTVEYYDLLEDLYQHNLVSKYHVPREVKRLRKQRETEQEGMAEDELVYDGSVAEVEVESVADMVDADDVEDRLEETMEEDEEEIYSSDGCLSYEDDDEILDENEDDGLYEGTGRAGKPYFLEEGEEGEEGEEEFAFVGDFSVVQVDESLQEDVVKSPTVEKKHAGELKRHQDKLLREELEEMKEEGIEIKEETKKVNPVFICVIIACVLLMVVLVILFVKITIDRSLAVHPQNSEAAYNTPYSAEEVAKYELGDKGELILKNEEGEILYDSGNQPQPDVVEEEIALAIVEEEREITQQYNDISGFEQNKDYKGLELVNLINGTQGADCTLKKANGAVVEVQRGKASMEDFMPSGSYRCQIVDGVLTFIEQ